MREPVGEIDPIIITIIIYKEIGTSPNLVEASTFTGNASQRGSCIFSIKRYSQA